jgi:hypothetical protein
MYSHRCIVSAPHLLLLRDLNLGDLNLNTAGS